MTKETTVEGNVLRKESLKCSCGSHASLRLKAKKGRYKDVIVTVLNVPVYECFDCGESFMIGTDSIRFASQVKKASLQDNKEILF
jgi:YgiT-type zinc finger domain-containing protein